MNGYRKEIKALLEEAHNKEQRDKIIDFIGSSSLKMKELMYFFLDEELHWRFNQRAAWPIGIIGRKFPDLIDPYLKEMVKRLGNAKHDAVNRNIVRIFEKISIPKGIEGELYDKCFYFLNHPEQPIAVRCFSITVLFKIAKKYKEMLPELRETLLLYEGEGSAGFKNRVYKTLDKIGNILNAKDV